jgi:hypothetical protein
MPTDLIIMFISYKACFIYGYLLQGQVYSSIFKNLFLIILVKVTFV